MSTTEETEAWKVGMFDRWNDYAKQLGYTGICDALSALATPQEAAPVTGELTEDEQAGIDALMYGTGFMVNGKRVAPESVVVAATPADESGQGWEAEVERLWNALATANDQLAEQCAKSESAERDREEACERLAWFAANPYDYRNMADKCSEAAAFLAANDSRGQMGERGDSHG